MTPQSLRFAAALTAAIFSTTQLTGCMAGNYGLVRSVANWNLRFQMVPRILLYIGMIIIPVYPLAMLFGVVINNTIEFWTNSPLVRAKNETFKKDGLRIDVAHTMDPLRRSVFTAYDREGRVQNVSELRETRNGTIEVVLNGQVKAEVSAIGDGMALLSVFSPAGRTNIHKIQTSPVTSMDQTQMIQSLRTQLAQVKINDGDRLANR